jgi:hypothetical protein
MCIGILDGICVTGTRDGKVFCSEQKYRRCNKSNYICIDRKLN